ncbi:hypothetical protein FisN_20Lh097 [Fistulifera solaris]|uniref:EamA domain-containing protein n=1 Tax=Fistulifera solaris TaxID=1519565 RepID=A0A1Z5JD21_FISSO|nr:hypothetical protein FisN_20Lh097 [Fistulifera solaris]|eukprot:GAX11846.1 hypothetical protein FisN_20Lh097 [Fistulifera solaris]
MKGNQVLVWILFVSLSDLMHSWTVPPPPYFLKRISSSFSASSRSAQLHRPQATQPRTSPDLDGRHYHDSDSEERLNFEDELEEQYTELVKLNGDAAAATIRPKAFVSDESASVPDVFWARLLVLGAATLYGSSFSFVKLMGENAPMPPGLTSTVRFGLAAISACPCVITSFGRRKSTEFAAVMAGLEVGLWNSIGYLAQAIGLETTMASKSAFLCSMAVVIVPLLDFIFKGKKLAPRQILGVVLAIMGVGALELGDVADTLTAESLISQGDWISMLQPLFFGFGFWRMEKAMHDFPDHPLRVTGGQLLAVFLGSALFTVIMEWNDIDIHEMKMYLADPWVWMSLAWTGLVTTALSIYMETVAMKSISAAETTLLMSSEPVTGSLFAAVIMGERLGPHSMIGSFLIFLSCTIPNLSNEVVQGVFDNGNASEKPETRKK